MKDLETKVEELQKASDAANQENGLLRAQIERLRVELREYRKRLSWMASGSGLSAMSTIPSAHSKGVYGLSNSEFLFDFPKFGGMPGAQPLGNGHATKTNSTLDLGVAGRDGKNQVPGILGLDGLGNSAAQRQTALSHSPNSIGPSSYHRDATAISSSSTSTAKGYGPSNNLTAGTNPVSSKTQPSKPSAKDTPNSGSPSSCSDSHQSQVLSSSRTSPEPDLNSSSVSKSHDVSIGHSCGLIDGERSFCEQLGLACGNVNNPIPPIRRRSSTNSHTASQPPSTTEPPLGLDWFAQQNGGQFDPVLFGDWREPQDAVLSQDFGDFFNDAFNIPELENEPDHKQPPKHDLVAQIDKKMDEDEEVVPGEDKSQLWTCTKIWYSSRDIQNSLLLWTRDANILLGTVYNLWKSSAMVRSMSTCFAQSCVLKRSVLRVALSLTKRTWTPLWVALVLATKVKIETGASSKRQVWNITCHHTFHNWKSTKRENCSVHQTL